MTLEGIEPSEAPAVLNKFSGGGGKAGVILKPQISHQFVNGFSEFGTPPVNDIN